MILGVGNDIVDIRRIEATLRRRGDLFRRRLFTDQEQTFARTKINEAMALARNYAVKEAVAKALGTGFSRGVAWRDIEIVRVKGAKPHIRLHGGALYHAWKLCPDTMKPDCDYSASDEPPYATAVAILFAVSTDSHQRADIPPTT